MLEMPEISQKTTKSPYKYNVVKIMKDESILEQAARDKVAGGLKKIRENQTSNSIFIEHRRQLKEEKEKSLIDPLTGLYNRRHLGFEVGNPTGVGELKREFEEAVRSRHDLSFFMIDVDNFKEYNDTHGHTEGDKALKAVADVLKLSGVLRKTDIPFRYGGEEFCILSPEMNIDGAKLLADRINKAVAKIQGLKRPITVSIGVASYHNSDKYFGKEFGDRIITDLNKTNPENNLVTKADAALYFSKFKGKNRFTFANDMTADNHEEVRKAKEEEKKNR